MSTFWDERFQQATYVYGEAPNDFLAANWQLFPKGELLSLGEGEGRNAVFLAEQGLKVTAMDSSQAGLAKLAQLAERRGVQVPTERGDLTQADLGHERWEGLYNIFCHLPSEARQALYGRIKQALKPGGLFLTEQFTPEQLNYTSGGPKDPDMLVTLDELRRAFGGWDVLVASEEVIQLDEGPFHQGAASVVRFIARKP
ncbi:MAG TPA: class I SAM-dependent methyltransferase [Stenomitos sp.]